MVPGDVSSSYVITAAASHDQLPLAQGRAGYHPWTLRGRGGVSVGELFARMGGSTRGS